MNRPLKYIITILAVLLVLILSLDIQKLDEYKAGQTVAVFNATEYADDVWENKLPYTIDKAPEIITLVDFLRENKETAFNEYGRKLGISKTWYFLVRDKGVITAVEDEYLTVQLSNREQIRIATSFIFGNAVRDGSGVVDISVFVNMTQFNDVSIALNKRVKEEVVSYLKQSARTGMNLIFAGVLEINEDASDFNTLTVVPVKALLMDE